MAAIGMPLAFLLVVELGLRVAGYGYPTSFFRPLKIGGQDYLVENDKFGWRFFPPSVARAPAPVRMPARKAPGTFRVFVLGESAALGDPRPAYGFSRYLEVLLNERFRTGRIEVVNLGVTAINAHAIREIARECAGLAGDAWVVYMGNNEYYGPFGAGTVFGPQAPSLAPVRARLALQSTRLGQLLAAGAAKWRGTPTTLTNWTGLRMFEGQEIPPDDPRRAVVHQNFARNAEAIVRAGVNAGARVILSSVAVNLRDCAPFASRHAGTVTESARTEWERLYQTAVQTLEGGDPQTALTNLALAVSRSPEYAEAQFRLAELELAGGQGQSAGKRFALARDCDAMPFRADSAINRVLRELAERWAGRGVEWLDAAAELGQGQAGGVPGAESFFEHVHFTFNGNYRLARRVAEVLKPTVEKVLGAPAGTSWASQARCERLLGLTDWNRAAVIESVLYRVLEPPYTAQLRAGYRWLALREQWREMRERMIPSAQIEARAVYEAAIQCAPEDHRLHENFAEFLEATGDPAAAAEEWTKVRDLIPHHLSGWYHAGRLLAATGKRLEARASLERALALRPDLVEAEVELAGIDMAEDKLDSALQRCDRALARRPDEPRLHVRRADILARLKRRDDAIASLREAIRVRPSHWEARYLLGVELAMDNQIPQAEAEFAEVVRLRPDHLLARVNLGTALARQLRFDEAEAQFNEALKLDPLNQRALQSLEAIKSLRERAAAARPQ
ncbi:MAG: tetratricopeptide repeat protein [Verrucomicrobia bacterium]|nr:tetratricopeptide repeat protein [Verrucomicrobiota bacterium]